jgi:DNA-binding winged helix-turn-helix (wHTH) protein
MPLQQELLLIFIKKPGQILTQQELISLLWPDQKATKTKRPALNLAIHRLRQVFAQGPLGTEVIRSIYGKGYSFEAPVATQHPPEPMLDRSLSAPASASKETQLQTYDRTMASRLFYFEAHD